MFSLRSLILFAFFVQSFGQSFGAISNASAMTCAQALNSGEWGVSLGALFPDATPEKMMSLETRERAQALGLRFTLQGDQLIVQRGEKQWAFVLDGLLQRIQIAKAQVGGLFSQTYLTIVSGGQIFAMVVRGDEWQAILPEALPPSVHEGIYDYTIHDLREDPTIDEYQIQIGSSNFGLPSKTIARKAEIVALVQKLKLREPAQLLGHRFKSPLPWGPDAFKLLLRKSRLTDAYGIPTYDSLYERTLQSLARNELPQFSSDEGDAIFYAFLLAFHTPHWFPLLQERLAQLTQGKVVLRESTDPHSFQRYSDPRAKYLELVDQSDPAAPKIRRLIFGPYPEPFFWDKP